MITSVGKIPFLLGALLNARCIFSSEESYLIGKIAFYTLDLQQCIREFFSEKDEMNCHTVYKGKLKLHGQDISNSAIYVMMNLSIKMNG